MTEQTFLPVPPKDPRPHPERAVAGVLPTSVTAGENNWENIRPEDFGSKWDYELENHITLWIFTPVSEAALQWCYAHLPANAPRWGAKGFVIEARYINEIVKGATRDGLMSPEEYEHAMEEANAIMHQGVEL